MDETQTNECAIEVMSSIVFLTGLIMLCLGLLRLGALNALLTGMLICKYYKLNSFNVNLQ